MRATATQNFHPIRSTLHIERRVERLMNWRKFAELFICQVVLDRWRGLLTLLQLRLLLGRCVRRRVLIILATRCLFVRSITLRYSVPIDLLRHLKPFSHSWHPRALWISRHANLIPYSTIATLWIFRVALHFSLSTNITCHRQPRPLGRGRSVHHESLRRILEGTMILQGILVTYS